MVEHISGTLTDTQIYNYVATPFLSLGDLAKSMDLSVAEISAMIDARRAPGAVYAADTRGWWSALGGYRSRQAGTSSDRAQRWYAPSAAWGRRSASLWQAGGLTYDASAARLRQGFQHDFVIAIAAIPEAILAFPDCIDGAGKVYEREALSRAAQEWEDWLSGGYAVCPRIFTAETWVRKKPLAKKLKQNMADPVGHPMTKDSALAISDGWFNSCCRLPLGSERRAPPASRSTPYWPVYRLGSNCHTEVDHA